LLPIPSRLSRRSWTSASSSTKEARRNQANTILKEVRFRLKIDTHDYETKRKRAEGFLQSGDKVKAMILFRGREQSRPEQGVRLLQRFAEDVAEFGSVESTPTIDGRNMVMVIGPLKNKAEAKAEAEARRVASKPPRTSDAAPAARTAPAPRVAEPKAEEPEVAAPAAPDSAAPEPAVAEAPVAPAVVAEPEAVEVPEVVAAPAAPVEKAAPKAATPKPATPKPATPKPATPRAAAPKPKTATKTSPIKDETDA
jgi:translation initiation factor IF-3